MPSRSSLIRLRFQAADLTLAVVVLLLGARSGWAWVALLLVLGGEIYRWRFRAGESVDGLDFAANSIARMSLLGIAVLTPSTIGKLLIGLVYLSSVFWLRPADSVEMAMRVAQTAVTQFLSLMVIFLAQAFWHFPAFLVVGWAWASSYVLAYRLLNHFEERAAAVLAAGWALLVSEASWIFSIWLVNYILPGGILTVPQPALVITALSYSLGGIYLSHRANHLSRTRLIEFLLIGLVALTVVISGTNWRGAI